MALTEREPVAFVVLLIIFGSLLQGMLRGASGSARRLFLFAWETVVVLACILLSWQLATWLSPLAADWLSQRVEVPKEELKPFAQAWYTFVTSVRDFALLRFGLLFLLLYSLLRFVLSFLAPLVLGLFTAVAGKAGDAPRRREEQLLGRASSRVTGAVLGAVHGSGRSFLLLGILFIYVSLMPGGPLVKGIEDSALYKETAQLLGPVAGDVLSGRGPVLADAVQTEFQNILKRKYEMIDYAVPAEIEEAALHITKDSPSDEVKARALYDWLGTRIAYDWDKARAYEQRGVWKEQTPEDTFRSRKGVCIDVARLYAMMARTAGLEVQVVTGLGADGRGGFGPHAWNEVKLGGQWVPLDATWASSGDWFNPKDFDATHIREA
ncbi:transglutaminase domain-containing protein [Paenibacillus sp. GCM10023252]|uniref:transglutaminase domain-containing protein n=1 Tax=Paenibacillus sp. GCM10023252 TaxID=3252649 RepID=UPI003615663C